MSRIRYLGAALLLVVVVTAITCVRRPLLEVGEPEDDIPGEMSPLLRAFLTARDLDDLGDARQRLETLDAQDAKVVRSLVEQWQHPQAVANLLVHPTLLPEDIRLATLLRGLEEQPVPYFVLAAIVGFGELDAEKLTPQDREKAVSRLLAILRETSDLRAERSSVSFRSFARDSNAPQVIALLEHSNKTVRHNLWAWLFHTFKDGEAEPVAAAARASGLPKKAQLRVVAEYKEAVTNPKDAFKTSGAPLLSYIPNLREYQPGAHQPEEDPTPSRLLRELAQSTKKSITPEQLTAVVATLKGRNVEACIAAAEALGRLGPEAKAALPALFDVVKDLGNPPYITSPGSVSEAAIAAALRIDPGCGAALAKASLPSQIAALEGQEQDGIRVAAQAVARLAPHARATVPALARALKAAKGYSVRPVVEALAAIGGEASRPLADLILDPNAPLQDREKAMMVIGEQETPEERQIAILIAALPDREPWMRAAAVAALQKHGPGAKSATPALLALLDDADLKKGEDRLWMKEKEVLVGALARIGESAISGLLAVVQDTNRPVLARSQAIRALGKIGRIAGSAQPALAAAMKDRSPEVAVEASGAYPLVGGDVRLAMPILRNGLRDESLPVQRAAVAAVERLGPKASELVPEVTIVLAHRNREVRRGAIRAIGTMGPAARPAVPALSRLLRVAEGQEDSNKAVPEALQRLGPDAAAALPALLERFKDLEKRSPNPVILAVGQLGREGRLAVPALVKLMETHDADWPFFSTDAIDALGEIGPEARAAVPRLIPQLRHGDQGTRADAARALGRIGPDARAGVPELEKRLKDVSLGVRIWAAFALIRITGEGKERLALMAGLWNKGEDLRLAEAFGELGAKARPVRDLLLQALEDETTKPGTHERVARALGRMRDEADVIVPRLLALMDRPGERFTRQQNREHALLALGLLGPRAKAAIPRMQELAKDNKEAISRAAAQALEKVEGK